MLQNEAQVEHGFLFRGGLLGRLIGAHRWEATSLGPIDQWPQSLKTVVSLILRSPVPIVTLWGEDGVMIYNDAYSVFAGGRHPQLLGSRVREGWPEVAEFNDNIMRVGLSGETLAYVDQELTLYRNGEPEQVWMNLDYSPILGEDSQPVGVIAIVVETTQRVLAERRIHGERARLAQMFEQAPSFMAVLEGPEHRFALVNPAYGRLIGRTDVLGKTLAEVLPEAAAQGFVDILNKAFESGRAYSATGATFILQSPADGTLNERYLDFVHQPITDERGRVTGVFIEGVDVTERTATEELFRVAQQGAHVGAFEWFPNGGKLVVSDEYRKIWGLPPDVEVNGDLLTGLVLPEDRDVTGQFRLGQSTNPLEHAEYRIRRPDTGEVRWLARRGEVLQRDPDSPPRYVGVAFDVTDRKQTEEALRETELRLRLALDAAAIGVWEYNLETGALTWDARVCAVAEVDPGAELHWETDFLAVVHPDDRSSVIGAFGEGVQKGEGADIALEIRILGRRTGKVTWSALQGRLIRDQAGQRRVIGTARDVTAERLANDNLHRLNETLERRVGEAIAERQIWADMVEGADDPIAAVDRELRFIAVNRAYQTACEHLFGVTFKIGDSIAEMLDHMPEARDGAIEIWGRAVAGEVLDLTERGETDKDGAYYDMKYRPLQNREGVRIGAYQISRDVTERVRAKRRLKEAEEALRQSQKMEAVGQLTGGIAHDFNNMLAVVLGSLDLLSRRIDATDARAKRYSDAAVDGAKRAAALTQRLLAFSRQQPLQPEPINPNKLVSGMSELLSHSLGGAVRLETVLAAGAWRVSADPNQLENVILNLAVNARDAMPEGGRLTIETQNVHIDERYAAANPDMAAGQYVMIAVTDTGTGMPPEVLAKAFDPFFTTKGVGKGTGLGLSQVYGFIKQSSGNVKIYSETGVGTTIKVYLPRLMGGDAEVQAEDGPPDLPLGEQHELVLVVEDEPAVRQFSIDALSELGYRVLEADGGAAALRLLDTRPDIALLFTDVVMPDMNGKRLADEARIRRPDLKVLFTTGYTRNAVVHNGVLDEGVELIGKPFTIEALAAKVRSVIDGQ